MKPATKDALIIAGSMAVVSIMAALAILLSLSLSGCSGPKYEPLPVNEWNCGPGRAQTVPPEGRRYETLQYCRQQLKAWKSPPEVQRYISRMVIEVAAETQDWKLDSTREVVESCTFLFPPEVCHGGTSSIADSLDSGTGR